MSRTGRRPGKTDTRQAIVHAAGEAFAARGYDGVTIRQVAAAAKVDPALIHHYFGTKDGLFHSALHAALDPEAILSRLLAGPPETLGQRLVTQLLQLWEGGAGKNASALLRTAIARDAIAQLVREIVLPTVTQHLVDRAGLHPTQAALRTTLVASQLCGLVVTRYLLVLQPLASQSPEAVGEYVGPTIQRYLTGPLPHSATPA